MGMQVDGVGGGTVVSAGTSTDARGKPWTDATRARFIKALAECANVTRAAMKIKRSRSQAYEERAANPTFAQAWDEAIEEAVELLEDEAWRRAAQGVEEPVVSMGKVVYSEDGVPLTVRRYSDTLMQTLLKAHRPEKYRENVKLSGSLAHSLVPSGDARALAVQLLEAVRDIPEARAAISTRLLERSGEEGDTL